MGLIWLHVAKRAARDGNPAEIRNAGGLLFFSIVNHSFSGVFGVVFTFASESRLVLRERIAGAYRVSSYYITYLLVELPRVAVWSLLHSVVIYWLAGLRPSAHAFLVFYAIHILVELNAEAITLLFTAATRSEKIASAVAPIPLVISILFGVWGRGSGTFAAGSRSLNAPPNSYRWLLRAAIQHSGMAALDPLRDLHALVIRRAGPQRVRRPHLHPLWATAAVLPLR